MLSLKQAAEAVGKGKSTIQRAIKAGKLSAQISDRGTYRIDPAELARVYPDDFSLDRETTKRTKPFQNSEMGRDETALLRFELEQVREQLAQHRRLSDREIEQAAETIADLRKRLDRSDEDKKSLTLLLEHHTKREPKPEGFLSKLFG
ncbi:MAG: helix-turn-helix domain-containing protein [Hyphomonas sp.]|jgi:excisionase family DNA binding protein|nr:helix-turn-helix domain-containing protein [Hyphomonas sp.]